MCHHTARDGAHLVHKSTVSIRTRMRYPIKEVDTRRDLPRKSVCRSPLIEANPVGAGAHEALFDQHDTDSTVLQTRALKWLDVTYLVSS